MTIAVMQPYIFPYIGYFQMISAVDKFLLYDDVNYIMRGWINRNYVISKEKEKIFFTLPLKKASPKSLINEVELLDGEKWKSKILKQLFLTYKKAPFFDDVFAKVIEPTFNNDLRLISDLNQKSLKSVLNFLDIEKDIQFSSNSHSNLQGLERTERLIEICKREGADTIIMPPGSRELYKKEDFKSMSVDLFFLTPRDSSLSYQQFSKRKFVPSLSILDVLMFNDKKDVINFLNQYNLE